jgi:hypothetical protein
MNGLAYVLLLCIQLSIAQKTESTRTNTTNVTAQSVSNKKISDNVLILKNVLHDKQQSLKYFNNLHALNTLFNHEYWIWDNFGKNVSKNCVHDMKVYLDNLRAGNYLAIQMSDASGRYGGSALMVNDFWLGSKWSCQQVNKELLDMDFNISQTHFSVARIIIQLQPLYPMVSIFSGNIITFLRKFL